MSIFTVAIGTDTYEVYGGLVACNSYLNGNSDDGSAAFRALEADDQARRLIGATRYLDSQPWVGAATGLVGATPTTLQFPRTGLADSRLLPVDSTTVPLVLVEAAFEMAAILAGDTSAAANADTGSNVQSLGAGPANLSFFRPQSIADGNATRLPTVVDRLIGRWLASGSVTVVAGIATGVDGRSDFREEACGGCGSTSGCSCVRGVRNVRWPV